MEKTTKQITLATPLRAEQSGQHWLLVDHDGNILATGLTKENADLIVGMSEQNEKMREALKVAELALTDGRIGTTSMDHPAFYSTLERAAVVVKAALAAGGGKV